MAVLIYVGPVSLNRMPGGCTENEPVFLSSVFQLTFYIYAFRVVGTRSFFEKNCCATQFYLYFLKYTNHEGTMADIVTTIKISEDLHEAIKANAAKLKVPMSRYMEWALEQEIQSGVVFNRVQNLNAQEPAKA